MKAHQITRLQELLDYIDGRLDTNLNLEHLASISCWSRWQLQRVFQLAFDQTVMAYVRSQRLAKAASELVNSAKTINAIAFDCGFDSQAVFSRVFKEHFNCTPKAYRQQGAMINISPKYLPPLIESRSSFTVEIKAKPSFYLVGRYKLFNSALSTNANNQQVLYELWHEVRQYFHRQSIQPPSFYALTDIKDAINDELDGITYWAGIETDNLNDFDELDHRLVPANNYAVFTHRGHLANLKQTLLVFLLDWLPRSAYTIEDRYELECHPFNQAPVDSDNFTFELWFPVIPR